MKFITDTLNHLKSQLSSYLSRHIVNLTLIFLMYLSYVAYKTGSVYIQALLPRQLKILVAIELIIIVLLSACSIYLFREKIKMNKILKNQIKFISRFHVLWNEHKEPCCPTHKVPFQIHCTGWLPGDDEFVCHQCPLIANYPRIYRLIDENGKKITLAEARKYISFP